MMVVVVIGTSGSVRNSRCLNSGHDGTPPLWELYISFWDVLSAVVLAGWDVFNESFVLVVGLVCPLLTSSSAPLGHVLLNRQDTLAR